ncbi:MAG: DUF6884 domain-containing protein [Candidatus Brocadiia bacterium]
MKTFVLISCASKKLTHMAKAKDLYVSQLFKLSLAYAQSLSPNASFILSAKHGLIGLEAEIEPYEQTLLAMTASQRRAWADKVLQELRQQADIQADHFVLLAGRKYREYLVPHLASFEVPLEGLRIGKQLQWLRNRLRGCSEA